MCPMRPRMTTRRPMQLGVARARTAAPVRIHRGSSQGPIRPAAPRAAAASAVTPTRATRPSRRTLVRAASPRSTKEPGARYRTERRAKAPTNACRLTRARAGHASDPTRSCAWAMSATTRAHAIRRAGAVLRRQGTTEQRAALVTGARALVITALVERARRVRRALHRTHATSGRWIARRECRSATIPRIAFPTERPAARTWFATRVRAALARAANHAAQVATRVSGGRRPARRAFKPARASATSWTAPTALAACVAPEPVTPG